MSTNYIDQITDTAGTTHDISEGDSTRIFRATCSTEAGTAAKVATLNSSNRNFSLTTGVRVAVTFTYGNSAATPTLRVDGSSTGTAKTIVTPTTVTTLTSGNGTTYNTWGPYETVIFTYNGTYWVKGASSLGAYTGQPISITTSSGNNQATLSANTRYQLSIGGNSYIFTTPPDNNSGGTVTSIATSSPISGGTITTSGTISHATSGVGNGISTAGFYKFKYDTYGHVTGVSSVTASDITGLVTIPSISLNGSSTTSPSFYAPTGAGSSGQYLKSNGSGAPSWATITIPDVSAYVPLTSDSVTIKSNVLRLQNKAGNTSQAGTYPYVTSIHIGDGREVTIDEYGDGYLGIHSKYGIFLQSNSTDIKVYDATKTYSVGELVWYDRKYYICTTAITTAEAWTSGHWTQIPNSAGTIVVDGSIQPITTGTKNLGTSDYKWNNLYATNINGTTIPSVTAKTTQAVYPVTINAVGMITGIGSAVTIPSIPSNNVTGSGTNGYLAKWSGTYTLTNGPALGSSTTTYLRNDGSWATPTDTDTKVTSSANHYTPSTASGNDKTASASGATAAWSIDVVKSITINTDGKGHITGLSVTSGKIPANPNTDEKVSVAALTSGTYYYPILATGTGTATRQIDSTLQGFKYSSSAGTTGIVGTAALYLGNSTASGTANNERGKIVLYGQQSYYTELYATTTTANTVINFPDKNGTIALTSGIPTKTSQLTNDSGFITSSTVKDYIIERKWSTDSNWYYEKWSSGKVEAWGKHTTDNLSMSSSGNLYRKDGLSASIPSGIFSATPTITHVFVSYTSAVTVSVSGNATSSTAISFQVYKATNSTAAVTVHFHCVYLPS